MNLQSHPAWGAWIEMMEALVLCGLMMSHPAWGAWIEINHLHATVERSQVAPRMGCVD